MIFEPVLAVITFGGTFWEKLSYCHMIFYNKQATLS